MRADISNPKGEPYHVENRCAGSGRAGGRGGHPPKDQRPAGRGLSAARGSVTDYVYLPRAVIPFFRRIIWNTADLSVLTGCITAAIALLWE